MNKSSPPRFAHWLLTKLHPDDTLEEVEGDLDELYTYWSTRSGKTQATLRYLLNVVSVLPPFVLRRKTNKQQYHNASNYRLAMLSNYLKIAYRSLVKHKGYSFINIGGLAVGMAVAILIGLWIYDELSFDRYFQNYDRIAKVLQTGTFEGEVFHGGYNPAPMGPELRTVYGDNFSHVVMSSWTDDHILAYGDKKLSKSGNYLSANAPDMLTLKMLSGTRAGLKDPSSILLSESVAYALFGTADPVGKSMKIDNKLDVNVTGVYEDFPYNTEFRDIKFIAPWELYLLDQPWIKEAQDSGVWGNFSWQVLVQIAPNTTFKTVSEKIKDIRLKHSPEVAFIKPKVILQPMREWHLYTGWDKAGNVEGRIQYVWLFGIIGVFVLLLACINFMNLSTARSEKRAKEVGIRKAVGSLRSQLISQFFSESLLVVAIAFVLAILLVQLTLPFFNDVADKRIGILWTSPVFWLLIIVFSLLTGLIAGSYPALYLSSFQPIKVLKGTGSSLRFRVGRFTSIPRQVLVVIQFTVSVTLIIGTVIVFQQIEYAKNRPVGYDRSGLITVAINTPELRQHYNALRNALLETGAIVDMSTSSAPATDLKSQNSGFDWEGKDLNFKDNLGTIAVSHDFGKTVGWQFVKGRDLSRQFTSDSSGMVLNETAVRYMGLKDPVGKQIRWNGKVFRVVGIIKDMLMASPFEPVLQTVYMLNYDWANVINIKLNPVRSASESLPKIEAVFRKFNPGSPFDYKFTDQEYASKFAAEERIGKLGLLFTVLAIFISCLGLFGLASFVAEQRTKEIGIRKVLGASVTSLWQLLSKDFVVLVLISCLFAAPTAWYFMGRWLQKYSYHTTLSWGVFAAASVGALSVTLLTVSFQSIKAALMNPVRSLRSE
ncbi:ABC transporter permease [Spirosoma terrae]|uniref:FtsX-like permease family protein n=1 Tax=Spirosoma terrae TaxID=1968276 RepID=A0A6L9LBD7_9BACT|nr:ABC transporter permease [Spirosoma terrae]NDU96113.1 FtsX-like permease family protein [Spirosoma terrae]